MTDESTTNENDKSPTCHVCGRPATIFSNDPYTEEFFPDEDNPEVWWCDRCHQDQLDDI